MYLALRAEAEHFKPMLAHPESGLRLNRGDHGIQVTARKFNSTVAGLANDMVAVGMRRSLVEATRGRIT